MADGGGDIIIKGGSVHVQFDPTMYERDEKADPVVHKHLTRKITRVLVTDELDAPRYDSGKDESGMVWTIKVFTSEKK